MKLNLSHKMKDLNNNDASVSDQHDNSPPFSILNASTSSCNTPSTTPKHVSIRTFQVDDTILSPDDSCHNTANISNQLHLVSGLTTQIIPSTPANKTIISDTTQVLGSHKSSFDPLASQTSAFGPTRDPAYANMQKQINEDSYVANMQRDLIEHITIHTNLMNEQQGFACEKNSKMNLIAKVNKYLFLKKTKSE